MLKSDDQIVYECRTHRRGRGKDFGQRMVAAGVLAVVVALEKTGSSSFISCSDGCVPSTKDPEWVPNRVTVTPQQI